MFKKSDIIIMVKFINVKIYSNLWMINLNKKMFNMITEYLLGEIV